MCILAALSLTFTTLAGTPGTVVNSQDGWCSAAQFAAPRGVAVDRAFGHSRRFDPDSVTAADLTPIRSQPQIWRRFTNTRRFSADRFFSRSDQFVSTQPLEKMSRWPGWWRVDWILGRMNTSHLECDARTFSSSVRPWRSIESCAEAFAKRPTTRHWPMSSTYPTYPALTLRLAE